MPKPVIKTITVPLALCRLLVAEPDDFKEPGKYQETQVASKALLKVLVEMHMQDFDLAANETR